MTCTILLILLATLWQDTATTSTKDSRDRESGIKLLTVCDILAEPLKFNGRMVRVRGAILGTDEGSWLAGRDCARPLIKDGFTWPNIIGLVTPDDTSQPHDVNFTWDRESYRQVQAEIRKLKIDWHKNTVLLTYTGVFETSDTLDFPLIIDASGRQRRMGFGYENGAAGQLLIKSVGGPPVVVPRAPFYGRAQGKPDH